MNGAEMAQRADANLAAYLAHLARTSGSGVVSERPGLLLFAGSHNYPGAFTNGVIRTGPGDPVTAVPAIEVLDAAADFFGRRRRGFVLWVRGAQDADLAAAARDAGLWQRPPPGGNPGLAIDHPVPEVDPPEGVTIRRVRDAGQRADYLRVVAATYGVGAVPLPVAEQILFSRASLDAPEVAAFVAYRGDAPVACCLVYLAAGAAGLQWAATVPAARGAGLGQLAFRAACNAGFALGARCAAGMASAAGTPVWTRQGMRVVTHYERYLGRPPAGSGGAQVSPGSGAVGSP